MFLGVRTSIDACVCVYVRVHVSVCVCMCFLGLRRYSYKDDGLSGYKQFDNVICVDLT